MNPKTSKVKTPGFDRTGVIVPFASVAAAVLIVLIACLIGVGDSTVEPDPVPTPSVVVTPEPDTDTTPEPEPTQSAFLAELAELHEENPDLFGWVTIEGTELDYPVMYTPEYEEKYLRKNFEGLWSLGGLPFMDKDCSADPESDNLIVYGHNMQDGSMFRTLMLYTDKSFWQEHPRVQFATLDVERTYDIIAVFYDRVYYKSEDCFKFYQFIDYDSEEAFEEAISYYKTHALYDTEVTAEYGDRLLTLVTCSYHHENGRFVMVAVERQTES